MSHQAQYSSLDHQASCGARSLPSDRRETAGRASKSGNREDRSNAPERFHELPPPIVMMGVPFDQVDRAQAISLIDEMIASGRPHQLATANVDFLAQAHSDPDLHRILATADLVVCDGMPLVWLSRLLGCALPERVAGSELVPLLFDLASRKGHRVFILGGSEESLHGATSQIRKRWPRLTLAGTYSPPFAPLAEMDHDAICARIRNARADLLLVAFGCPKQEKWLAMNLAKTGVPVGIGVGASIDFLAGKVRQAPRWMRACSLEWIWRIMQEPRRLAGRYLNDIFVVGPALLVQLWKMRGRGFFLKSGPTSPASSGSASPRWRSLPTSHKVHSLILPPRFDAPQVHDCPFGDTFEDSDIPWLLIDASKTVFLDSTATGRLLRLSRLARQRGGGVALIQPHSNVLATLALMKLQDHFVLADSPSGLPVWNQCETSNSEVTLVWPPEVSAATKADLGAEALEHLRKGSSSSSITIDLSAVRFIDSTGIGMMLRLRREAQRNASPLVFVNPSEEVSLILKSLNLLGYLFDS